MKFRWLALVSLLVLPSAVLAQTRPATNPRNRTTSPASTPSSADKASAVTAPATGTDSHDPLVVEQYLTSARFENDGTGESTLTVRMHVQSAAGAQQLRSLAFPFNSANQQIDVLYLRVRKADGTVVPAAADAVKDDTPSTVHDAPAYANVKEKHIAVPALAPGDTIEYEIATRIVKPLAPGEFWFQHDFLSGEPARDERVEVSVPQNRAVIVHSPDFPYEKTSAAGRTIYLWHRGDLRHPSDKEDTSRQKPPPGDAPPPDIELSTFATWNDVARWYAELERGRSDPTPEIQAKTKSLIQGRSTDLDKIQAIYNYVSKNIRYVSIPLGEDGYEPAAAADVFKNQYGDARDKQSLLAAMLSAAGFSADAALIPYESELETAVPSPSQLDHVVTAVPLGNDLVWMDSTIGVAPFRLLPAPLRGKSALLVSTQNRSGRLVETPADPPFLSVQEVSVDGKVSDLGKLTAYAHYSLRGDTELALRLAFQTTPQSQWKSLGQTVLTYDGLHGQVTAVKPSDPTDTSKPFEFDLVFTESNLFDWSSKQSRTELPLLAIGLPDAPASKTRRIDLGSPLSVNVHLKLDFPPNFSARPPVGISVARDYAEFKSTYQFSDHTLMAERSLSFKMHSLPPTRTDDYQQFTRSVTADESQPLVIDDTAPGPVIVPSSAAPDELFEAGVAALDAGNPRSAIPLFQRLVEVDPQHKQAWNELGLADLRAGNNEQAADAFQKQLAIDPADEHAEDYLGVALERQQKYDEAAMAFRKQVAAKPLDPVAHAALGEIFLEQHRDSEAIPELEKAAVLSPENPGIPLSLGRVYLDTGDIVKAADAFDRGARMSPTPTVWNEIAYRLATAKAELDKAEQYATQSVSATDANLRDVDLLRVTPEQLRDVASLGAYWDTLGWVYFQEGQIDRAEPYIQAAWLLDFDGESGDHLAQIYETRGQKDRAIQTSALALAGPHPFADTRARLTLLLGGNARIDDLVRQAKPEFESLRTFPVGKLLRQDAHADFLVLLSPGDKHAHVEGVRFLDGSEDLRPFADRLRAIDFGAVFPDASQVEIVRRGTLACSAASGDCTFMLTPAEDALNSN